MPPRPLVFALGLLLCLAAAITCATAPAHEPHTFPSLSDGLVVGGLVLVVLGGAGRDPRGRQLLGRRPRAPRAPVPSSSHDAPPGDPDARD